MPHRSSGSMLTLCGVTSPRRFWRERSFRLFKHTLLVRHPPDNTWWGCTCEQKCLNLPLQSPPNQAPLCTVWRIREPENSQRVSGCVSDVFLTFLSCDWNNTGRMECRCFVFSLLACIFFYSFFLLSTPLLILCISNMCEQVKSICVNKWCSLSPVVCCMCVRATPDHLRTWWEVTAGKKCHQLTLGGRQGSGREGDDGTKINHMNCFVVKTFFIPPFETSKSKQSSFNISSQESTCPASENVYVIKNEIIKI